MLAGLEATAMALLAQYGFFALLIFAFLETSLLFPFIPSELVVPAAAALLVTGPASFLAFVLAVTVGSTVGSLFVYYVSDATHQPIVDRFGTYVRISATDLERASDWFDHWGESSVFWGRLLPVLRSVISIPAGVAGMGVTKFAAYSAGGSGLFAASVAALVRTGRELVPSQLLAAWLTTLFDHTVAIARANPVLAVAVFGLALFVALFVRNVVARRPSFR